MKLKIPDYLNDNPQNVIYRQDDSWKFTSKWCTAICTKGRSVLTVSVLCGALSMSSQLQSYKLHSRGTDLLHFTHTGIASCRVRLEVQSLRNLFLLFLVPQMSSDCLGLLLGLTLPLHPPLFPNSWTMSLPTGGSARRMLKTIMHLRSRWRSLCFTLRGNHLLVSPPTLWHKSRPNRDVQPLSHSSASSLSGTRAGAVGE